jgi:hypothetical protein
MSSTAPQASPELLAVDLVRVPIDAMGVDELVEHVEALRQVMLALVQSRHLRPHISMHAAANLDRLLRKVQAKLAHALDVLSDLRVAAAWLDAARQERERAGSECRPSRMEL